MADEPTPDPTHEQASTGSDRPSPYGFEEVNRANDAYKSKVGSSPSGSIRDPASKSAAQRSQNPGDVEAGVALAEMYEMMRPRKTPSRTHNGRKPRREVITMRFPTVTLELPDWVEELDLDRDYSTEEDRMRLAVELSRLNVKHGSGGPFGAAVFDLNTNRLVAPGMNLVVPFGCSVAHAEMVAIMIAQQVVGDFDLGGEGKPPYELVASTEPCAMCFGATPWSGVRSLLCGARDEDARAVGFDEGAKLSYWAGALEKRGISVKRDVLREEAAGVLRYYAESGGEIYNARQGD